MSQSMLLVEDEHEFQEFLKNVLVRNGYSVQTASKGIEALQFIEAHEPDLVLLDLNLPDIKGESICAEIRKQYPHLPIIILTAKDAVSAKVEGFNLGADDYVTKPVNVDELTARIKAQLRRAHAIQDNILKMADLELDTKKVEVRRAGKLISLTPQEFRLLEYFMRHKGTVLSRDMILNRVWSYSFEVESRVVDVYIGYLRKKIDAGYRKKLIQSVRGFGYMIKE